MEVAAKSMKDVAQLMGEVEELVVELAPVCRRLPTLKFIANVRIFFPQPPLRTDSFGTEMGLVEKKRFME